MFSSRKGSVQSIKSNKSALGFDNNTRNRQPSGYFYD
jgi:hypothetical protein